MKKGIKLLISMLLFIPMIVLADVAVPDYITFEVEVINDEGIDYYEYSELGEGKPEGHLEKGTKLKAEYEITQGNERYLLCTYKKHSIYVKVTDVVAIGEYKVKDKDVITLDEPRKIRINDEIIVRKGPSSAYPEVGRIKEGETTFSYMTTEPRYYYVDYEGVRGWFNPDEANLDYGLNDSITYEPINSGSCGTIPIGTVFTDLWVDTYGSGMVELEYNGCKFNADYYKSLVSLAKVKKIYKLKDRKMFENGAGERIALDKDVEFTVLSEQHLGHYYIEVGNEKGWFQVDLDSEAKYLKDYKEPKKEKDRDKDDDEESDTNVIVLSCVIAAVAFVLGSLVTIILVNRKKKGVPVEEDNEKK